MSDSSAPDFLFVGNHPCLDFVNTEMVVAGSPVDLLQDFWDVVRWLQAAGLADEEAIRRCRERWANSPATEDAFRQAIELRQQIREALPRLEKGPPPSLLNTINGLLSSVAFDERLEMREQRVVRGRRWSPREPEDVLAPLADMAAVFLSTADPALVRKCESPTCVLWFLDTTKNKGRRWCSMAMCGNRHKAAEHYRRTRGA